MSLQYQKSYGVSLSVFISENPLRLKCYRFPFLYPSNIKEVNDIVWSLVRTLSRAGIAVSTIRKGYFYFKGNKEKLATLIQRIITRDTRILCKVEDVEEVLVSSYDKQNKQIIRELFYRALNRVALRNYIVMKIRNIDYYVLREKIAREDPDL